MPGRQDQYQATLRVNGADFGVWDTKTGGSRESEGNTYKPGGMRQPISLGGSPSTENVTLSKIANPDHEAQLTPVCGTGAAEIAVQPLDDAGIPFSRATIYTGTLVRVAPPEHNSEASDAAMLEVEVSVAGHSHA